MSRTPLAATAWILDDRAFTDWAMVQQDQSQAEWMVRDCLEAMPRRDRDLLMAYYYERLTYKQLAERFGWTNKGSAHWQVRRAIGRLRERLERASGT